MEVCDLCGTEDIIWSDGQFALCKEHCEEALKENMASPEQKKGIEKALKEDSTA